MEFPPWAGSKKLPPRLRSMNSRIRAAASTGMASSPSSDVTSVFHTKIGRRNIVMPGARILKIVVMKLIEPSSDAAAIRIRPTIHRSWPFSPSWAVCSDSGA